MEGEMWSQCLAGRAGTSVWKDFERRGKKLVV